MQLSLTNLVCVLFDPAIPTSSFYIFHLIVFILVNIAIPQKDIQYDDVLHVSGFILNSDHTRS